MSSKDLTPHFFKFSHSGWSISDPAGAERIHVYSVYAIYITVLSLFDSSLSFEPESHPVSLPYLSGSTQRTFNSSPYLKDCSFLSRPTLTFILSLAIVYVAAGYSTRQPTTSLPSNSSSRATDGLCKRLVALPSFVMPSLSVSLLLWNSFLSNGLYQTISSLHSFL